MFPGCVDSVFVAWIDCRDTVLVKVYLVSYEKINKFFFFFLELQRGDYNGSKNLREDL